MFAISDYDRVKNLVTPANVMDIIPELEKLTMVERERLSFETGTRAVYLGEEVHRYQAAEEQAALVAAPAGYELSQLNGLNIGCGGRLISSYLTPIDIARVGLDGGHVVASSTAIMCAPDDLPFKPDSIDYIVALHMLEHVADPINVIRYWISLLKPGGGVGIILPDWRYAWDARNDQSPYGHKWNSTSDTVLNGWRRHLSDCCILERINTLPYKASFDVVFRKPGTFTAFDASKLPLAKRRTHHHDGSIDL